MENYSSKIRQDELPDDRYDNFDALRIVAALLVIFSHAFLIADGTEAHEPFVVLLGSHNILGLYAVQVFLMISGFLISRSAMLSSSTVSFLWKRILRIYPALIVCALLLGLVIAPIFSALGPRAFLVSGLGLRYALATALWPGHVWQIDTVRFYEDQTGWLGEVMAGTLWTIPHELFCYLLLAVLVLLSLNRLSILAPLFVLIMVLRFVPGLWGDGMASQFFLLLLPSFLAGCIFWQLRDRQRAGWAIIGLVATIISAFMGELMSLFPLVAAYPILYFAAARSTRLPGLGGLGDISYGLYLYGWPAAQIARALLGDDGSEWWSIWLLSTAFAIPCALLSWHLVEKPALRLKRRRPPGRETFPVPTGIH